MFFLRMYRKPLLPLLLFFSILTGIVFPSVLHQSIQKNYSELDNLYESMTIHCKLLPQAHLGDGFLLAPEIANRICELDSVSEYYYELNCPYYFRDPGPSSGNSTAYGTTDIHKFSENHGITLNLSSGYEDIDFSGSENICLVSQDLLKAASRSIGDSVTVAGSELREEKNENAPDLYLTIVGTFETTETEMPWNAIITPAACFFDTDELIYSSEGIRKWRLLTAFEFTIDSSYNREFDSVKDSLQDIIGNEWMLYSTSRELYNAIKPLENKLRMQQNIYEVLTTLLLLFPAFITILICNKEKNEMLIRMIHGEKIGEVFWTSWLSLASLIVIFGLLSVTILSFIDSINLIYIGGMSACSVLAVTISLTTTCRKRLVALYQSREG